MAEPFADKPFARESWFRPWHTVASIGMRAFGGRIVRAACGREFVAAEWSDRLGEYDGCRSKACQKARAKRGDE